MGWAASDGGGQVPGEGVKEKTHIRGALDVVFAPEGIDAAAGDPHVAQQLLQDGVPPDNLHAGGVLGAPHGIEKGPGLVRPAGGAKQGGELREGVL